MPNISAKAYRSLNFFNNKNFTLEQKKIIVENIIERQSKNPRSLFRYF